MPFTPTVTEAVDLLENLSLNSQTKTAEIPEPAKKVTRILDLFIYKRNFP